VVLIAHFGKGPATPPFDVGDFEAPSSYKR
jgi:hypothetical protein